MNDREFLKLFTGLMGALIALTVVLLVLANVVAGRSIFAEPSTSAVAARIEPVGKLAIGEAPPASPHGGVNVIASANAAEPASGQNVFQQTCAACHATGVAGAPRVGDQAAWKDRIAKGKDTLYQHALHGFQGNSGFMPPKGGNASLSDAQVEAAVDYMVSQAK